MNELLKLMINHPFKTAFVAVVVGAVAEEIVATVRGGGPLVRINIGNKPEEKKN